MWIANRSQTSSDRPAHRVLPHPAKTLDQLAPAQEGRVLSVEGRGAVRQRLFDLGLLPGARVTLVRVAPAGDPIWIGLGHGQLALRRSESMAIKIA